MPVTVICPNPACARAATVADEHVGRTARCKGCGRSFTLRPTIDVSPADTARPDSPIEPERELKCIGRFRVLARLGSGAFGTVYRAYDSHLEREVALKVPRDGVLDCPKRVERFLREAKTAARLQHPHIVPVFDAGQDGDRYYIASAFIDGRPLAEEIEGSGLKFQRAARIVRSLAEAAAYAHGQGVVHRDIKPDNVMLDRADMPHLMDFGLAAQQDAADRLTHDGAILGTPAYMAPEQAAGQRGEAQPASDQYSLGALFYELLTGRTPFVGPLEVVLYNAQSCEPDLPRKHRPAVPRDLEIICLKAMAKRPEDRYPTCQELADDLRRWLEGEPIAARRVGLTERVVRWGKRNPAVAGLTLTVAGLLVFGTAVATGLALHAREKAADAERNAEQARLNAERADQNAQRADRNAADARQRAVTEAELRKRSEESEQQSKDQRAIAEAVSAFLLNDLIGQVDVANQSGDGGRDPDVKVVTLLGRAARQVEAKFADQPLTEAAIHLTLGNAYMALGRYSESQPHLERYSGPRKLDRQVS